MTPVLAYLLCALIGCVAAASELVSRYRDDPWQAVTAWAALGYLLLNVCVSIAALFLIREVFQIYGSAGAPTSVLKEMVMEVLAAGVGGMAVLRSNVLTVRIGATDMPIGPGAILDVFRSAVDRDIDRVRAQPRANDVSEIMRGVSFARAARPLTSIALNLLQNIGADERATVEQQVDALASQTDRSDHSKALELGLILAGSVGFPVLKTAVGVIKNEIGVGAPTPELVAEALPRLRPAVIASELPATCLALAEHLTPEDQEAVSRTVDGLVASGVSESARSINICIVLVNFVGEETFRAALDLLDPRSVDP